MVSSLTISELWLKPTRSFAEPTVFPTGGYPDCNLTRCEDHWTDEWSACDAVCSGGTMTRALQIPIDSAEEVFFYKSECMIISMPGYSGVADYPGVDTAGAWFRSFIHTYAPIVGITGDVPCCV